MLQIIDVGRTDVDGGQLPLTVMEGLHRLVPSDVVSFVEIDPPNRRTLADVQFPPEPDPAPAAEPPDDPFWGNFWDCRSCCYSVVSGDDRTVTAISDFYSLRELHATGMYADVLRPAGVERELVVSLSAPAGRSRRLLFSRGPGPDFSRRDRLVLSLLRPHLDELYQDLLLRRRPAAALTGRQSELLELVRQGYSNDEIARRLCVSVTTVRKHLENIFQRLGVASRSAAVARVFPSRPL
jgi:DNA-binding CsgD family transcriptional regulator